MWYPEEPITYCRTCDKDVPFDCFWRGRGFIITADGREIRTSVLYSQCPDCNRRLSVGLEGPFWYRVFYGWLWKLRYPETRPPFMDFPAPQRPRKRASGR